jgi:hypothetical protein
MKAEIRLAIGYLIFIAVYVFFFDVCKSPYIFIFIAIGTIITFQKLQELRE